ncbi:MAG: fumarate hydratase, partial [Epsilonproteobacteria bacterium]|nr:fumarate hydratase [Campylobacterota bacterium]
MREIAYEDIVKAVKNLVMHTATHLPEDALKKLKEAHEKEKSPVAKKVLEQLLENAEIARSEERPLCQDTGLAVYFIKVGQDVRITGGLLKDAVNEGTEQGYKEGYLRASTCECFSRRNLKEEVGYNLPAVIHIDIVEGDKIEIEYAAKGGGSENVSRARVLAPAQGAEGVKAFVKEVISEAGPNPCPPIIVGVGIGGTFEKAAISSKYALFREAGTPNPD